MGFRESPEMGLKWVEKWVLTHFDPLLHFWPTFGPISAHWQKPHLKPTLSANKFGDLKITSASTERQKRSQNLAPVLVIFSGNSLVFLGKLLPVLVFTGAPVVVKNQSPINSSPKRALRQPWPSITEVLQGFVEQIGVFTLCSSLAQADFAWGCC